MTSTQLALTDRTTVHRLRERQVRDTSTLYEILDEGLVAHVAACIDGSPVVLPLAYARDGNRLLLHGSTGAGLLRALAAGVPVAVSVTLLDGLVYARSIFDSSVNYRSAVIFGTPVALSGEEKLSALRLLSEHLMPHRWEEVRPPSNRELASTLVLALPLDEASVKVRTGGPSRDDEEPSAWAGVLPLAVHAGDPVPAQDVPSGVEPPPSLAAARRRHGEALGGTPNPSPHK